MKFLRPLLIISSLLFLLAVIPVLAASNIRITPIRLQLVLGGPEPGTERVSWTADAALLEASDGILPTREEVLFTLSLPATLDSPEKVFYTARILAGGLSSNLDGTVFTLNQAGKDQSGLESFKLEQTGPGTYRVTLGDVRASLVQDNYATVAATLTIGNDFGNANISLTKLGNTWKTDI